MVNGIRTGKPRGFNKGRSSKFRVGYRVRQTLEGRRTYRPKCCGNNTKDEDNSLKKTLMIKIIKPRLRNLDNSNCSIWPIDRTLSGATTPAREDLEVLKVKGHSPKLHNWSHSIRLFNNINRTFFGGGFILLQRCSRGLRNRSKWVRTPVAPLRSLSGKYPWERYEPPYPPSYGLNSTTTVLLGKWLWH